MEANKLNIGDRFTLLGSTVFFVVTNVHSNGGIIGYRRDDEDPNNFKEKYTNGVNRVIKYKPLGEETCIIAENDDDEFEDSFTETEIREAVNKAIEDSSDLSNDIVEDYLKTFLSKLYKNLGVQ